MPQGAARLPHPQASAGRGKVGRVNRRIAAVAALTAVGLSGCSSPTPATPAAPGTPAAPVSSVAATASPAQLIQEAQDAVKAGLPDAPLWKGVTFTGTLLDATHACVDRTYPPDGGLDGKGGSAGYVVVTFPEKAIGKPMDGRCAADTPTTATSTTPPPVVVPEEFKGKPGLVTRTDLGEQWPLRVDYGVITCQNKILTDRVLPIALFTAPDGTVYALNGTAKSHTTAADIEPIWLPNPEVSGLKIDIGPLIDRALALCPTP